MIPAVSALASFSTACLMPRGYLIARVVAVIIASPTSLVIVST
jgi:hypothetical protein